MLRELRNSDFQKIKVSKFIIANLKNNIRNIGL